jgi:hypothetical protein
MKAEDLYWYKHPDLPDMDSFLNRMKLRYDVLAKRSGFKYDKKMKAYVLLLG